MTLLVVNVLALDAVLLVLGAITAAAYRRFRRPIPASSPYATFTVPAHVDLDAYAAPRPDEEPPW